MAKNTNKKEVISENTKGNAKKDNIFEKIINILKKHYKILISIISLIVILIISLIIINNDKNYKIITINDIDYYSDDFMMYLYSAKYNYFKDKEITEDDLNVVVNNDSNITVRELLKETALNDLKTASAIKKMAEDNNISLNEKELEELTEEKKDFIKSLGSKKEFKKFLKNNQTTEKAYDNMSEIDKLYKKIIKKLYSLGKVNDLTEEEMDMAKTNYNSNYVKIKQIILTTIDLNSGKNLSSTTINQKETLAKSIVEEAKNGVEFDKLISKYSEDAVDKEPPYETYYKKGELLSELETVALELKNGEVSKPIKTKYAFHIIQKLELDDFKYEDYLNDLRTNKCIEDLKEYLDELKVINHEAYNKIKIK